MKRWKCTRTFNKCITISWIFPKLDTEHKLHFHLLRESRNFFNEPNPPCANYQKRGHFFIFVSFLYCCYRFKWNFKWYSQNSFIWKANSIICIYFSFFPPFHLVNLKIVCAKSEICFVLFFFSFYDSKSWIWKSKNRLTMNHDSKTHLTAKTWKKNEPFHFSPLSASFPFLVCINIRIFQATFSLLSFLCNWFEMVSL